MQANRFIMDVSVLAESPLLLLSKIMYSSLNKNTNFNIIHA